METKKILRQYFFCVVSIFCVGTFFFGTVSVREKTRYNMDMTSYEKIEIIHEDGRIIIRSQDNDTVIRTDYAEMVKELIGERIIL